MEVAQDIHRIEAPLGDRVIYLYVLVGRERVVLVDTGMDTTPREYLVPALDALGLRPEQIDYAVITHSDFDHQGGNVSLREIAPDVCLMCHGLDVSLIESIDRLIDGRYGEFRADHGIDDPDETKAWIRANSRSEVPIDITLTGGETIQLGPGWRIEVLHTPGHSSGHLSLHDPRSRTLIIADAALWNCVPTRTGAPAFPPTYRYVDSTLASLQRFQSMPVDLLLTSHYPQRLAGHAVAEFLAESRAFVERVEAALCDELERVRSPRTTRELIDALGPRLGRWPEDHGIYLAFPLMGHLERLHQRGRIEAGRRDGWVTWRWTG